MEFAFYAVRFGGDTVARYWDLGKEGFQYLAFISTFGVCLEEDRQIGEEIV